jgi:hypothetical protein
MKYIEFFCFCLLIGIAFFSGCASLSQPELHAHYEYKGDFSLGLGCYERVSGYVYNSGNAPANSAILYFTLVNTRTGTIRDSKTLSIGYIGQGESRTFETTLDGDCGIDYRIDISIK